MAFNRAQNLKPRGTVWVSGTYHNIFQVAHCLQELDYKILNVITWQKTNPPLTCHADILLILQSLLSGLAERRKSRIFLTTN